MWKRFFAYLKALFAAETKLLDDPEGLLEQAQIEMRERQSMNRKRAAEAVTARNNLQQQCTDMRKRLDALNAKANEAERRGDKEEAQKLRRECEKYKETLTMMETQLARANELCEQVKVALEREQRAREREEENIRKLREALETKVQWPNAINENDPYPIHNDVTIKWVFALIILCLLALLILRTVG